MHDLDQNNEGEILDSKNDICEVLYIKWKNE